MKRFISLVAILTILGIASFSFADSTQPDGNEPKNYPVVWTASVYNGSGSDIASGYIAQWDFDTSNSTALDGTWFDDMCPWVKLNATDEGVWTAGVVPYGKNLVNGDTGSIIIRGPAYVIVGSALTADNLVSSDANGQCAPFDGGANDESTLGIAIKVSSLSGGPDSKVTGIGGWAVIYVNPTAFDEN